MSAALAFQDQSATKEGKTPPVSAKAGTRSRGSGRARRALKIPVASWCARNAETGLLEQSQERGPSEATACKATRARKARRKVQEMQEMQDMQEMRERRRVFGGAKLDSYEAKHVGWAHAARKQHAWS